MKNIFVVLLVGAMTAQAGIVTFDESVFFSTWDGSKWTGGPTGAGPMTFDVEQDGITFRLGLDASINGTAANIGNSVFAQSLGVNAGIKTWELDQGSFAANTLDDETLTFSLSIVSGSENLQSISLLGVNMRLFGTTDRVAFSDQNNQSVTHSGSGTPAGNTDNVLVSDFSGLSQLSKANLATWEMNVTALDADNDYSWWTGAENNSVQAQNSTRTNVNSLSFEYAAIPEPATMGLILMTGVGLIGMRRLFG